MVTFLRFDHTCLTVLFICNTWSRCCIHATRCFYATSRMVVAFTQHPGNETHLQHDRGVGVGGYRARLCTVDVYVRSENNFYFFYLQNYLLPVSFLPQRLTWCARSDREEAESRMKSPVTRSAVYLRQMSASAHRLHGCWRSRPPGRMTLHVTGAVL